MATKSKIEYLWNDRKRILGMPLSFTKYSLSKDRIFVKTGFFTSKFEEVVLYRVRDLSLSRSLWQKLFGVGSVTVQSSDKSMPTLVLKNIKKSFEVKELLHACIEEMKKERRMRIGEIVGDDDDLDDDDGDGNGI
ncbi:MAG: PH domain-containing protein [Clostridia bacterium]|nr:PH domain-containing protein [Clostridia bacterium]